MYKTDDNNDYGTLIEINLDNGIYIFDNQSATGKTRLCKALRDCQKYGEPVASYTYDDKLLEMPIERVLVPDKYKVIMLDRYDLYEGDGAELIKECADNSIILIDCKGDFTVCSTDEWCTISMAEDKIEVTQ